MNRVRNRAWIMMVFIVVLVGGLCFFLFEYAAYSQNWMRYKGSGNAFSGTSGIRGSIVDRDGEVLLELSDQRSYADDKLLRQSTLHWLGDVQGNIQPGLQSQYSSAMSGFDKINGTYAYGDGTGRMELTISARVQKAALKALNGRKGTVAVYNYKTGQILCAVTAPTFDPDNVPDIAGDTTGMYEGVYLNRFVQSTYPPGSIFKIVTTAAALDCLEGAEELTFTCTGVYEFGVDKVTCESVHGTNNLKNAFARSCNCAFAQLAQLLGKDTLEEYVDKFRLRESLSFDGMTTAKGNFDISDAAAVELAWSAIGQYTDMVNPARFLKFVGDIASGGSGAVPYIVEEVQVGRKTTYQAKTSREESVLSGKTAQLVGEYMRNNVVNIYGSGHFPGLTVCAKSGTSELGGGKTPNAMFTGFVSDEEYPLAFIVVVENGGYGSHTCVPILSAVLAECKALLDGK